MKVLVFAEQRDTKLKAAAFESLGVGSKMAGGAADLAAVIIGKGVEGLAGELAGFGADTVYVADQDDLETYNVIAYTAALEEAIKAHGAEVVIAPATPMGRDLCARTAAKLDAALVSDVTEIKLEGNQIVATKPMYAGKVLAEVTLQNASVQIASIRPNVFPADKSGDGSAAVNKLSVTVPESKLKTVEIRKGAGGKIDLTEANAIVSGGRAMGNADAFKLLDECADVLGGAVGASRAAVDAGYATHSMQVGQTGKTVNPNLYVAAGISGAIQHLAGMRTSKCIVAINNDADAPIFQAADYGIVADLFEAVPEMTKKLKEMIG